MHITFDLVKDLANLRKHRVSLGLAEYMDWSMLMTIPDRRRSYGEDRYVGYGRIGSRLYCVVFVDRGEQRRVISLRKANLREVIRYAQA